MYSREPRDSPRRALHGHAELRREHDPVAAARRAPGRCTPRSSPAVDVGRVEEGDALVERRVDDRARLLEVAAAAEVVRAEPNDGDLGPAVAQWPRAH